MKVAAALGWVVLLAGCADEAGQLGPPPGGTPPPSGGRSIDAGSDAGADAGADANPNQADAAPPADAIAGRLCDAPNLLDPEACPSGADFTGVLVANASTGDTAFASSDGTFELPKTPGLGAAALRLAPADGLYRTSLVGIALRADGSAGPVDLPVMAEEDWITLTNTIAAPNFVGQAAIVAYVIDAGGNPVAGATLLSGPVDAEVFFDDGGALSWDQDLQGTGAAGVILMTGLETVDSSRTFTITDGTSNTTVENVAIEPDTITFVTAVL